MSNMPPSLNELHARRDEILTVAAQHGVSNVRIVGSTLVRLKILRNTLRTVS